MGKLQDVDDHFCSKNFKFVAINTMEIISMIKVLTLTSNLTD